MLDKLKELIDKALDDDKRHPVVSLSRRTYGSAGGF